MSTKIKITSSLARRILFACFLSVIVSSPARAVDDFVFIVGADPQAWRLDTGDPNSQSNRGPWLNVANPTYRSMKDFGASFLIINGDMTEYGRAQTWTDTRSATSGAGVPVLFGLGNHDYANNVHDCSDGLNAFMDHCAVQSIVQITSNFSPQKNFGGQSGLNIVSNDWETSLDEDHLIYKITGSLAYSFQYGGVHFIQLNYCPTYSVTLTNDSYYEAYISDSLAWLRHDISSARQSGHPIVLNYHDGTDDHNADQCRVSDDFLSLVKQVDVVFTGHTHAFDFDTDLGVPKFTADAIFHGGYYMVIVTETGMRVGRFNGSSGRGVPLDHARTVTFRPPPPAICSPRMDQPSCIPPRRPFPVKESPARHWTRHSKIIRSGIRCRSAIRRSRITTPGAAVTCPSTSTSTP